MSNHKERLAEKTEQDKTRVTQMYNERVAGCSMEDLSVKYQLSQTAIYNKFKKFGFGGIRIDHRKQQVINLLAPNMIDASAEFIQSNKINMENIDKTVHKIIKHV